MAENSNANGNTQLFIAKVGDDQYSTKAPMGYLDLPSENYEDFVFTVDGIGIEQNGETVADATYGFYKYMHFDGTYNNEVKVTVQHTQEAVDNADVDAEGNKLDILAMS